MSKIIQAVFSSGKFATTTDVFQWDKGDILQIEGLDLPESYEVHFSNSLNTPALVVSASGNSVETPAEVFENSGREVYAWVVVLESANVYHTIGQIRIPINPRGMPADLIPTPDYVPDRSKSAIKEAVDAWLAEHSPEIRDGIPYAVKDALITLFEHAAYIDGQGQTYLNNLKRAFALVKSLVSIEAVLDTGGAEITDSDTLGTLRQYLTVTATYDDGSTATVTDYTLSGALEIGTSTIVVTYGGASDTVEVEVTGTKVLLSIGAVFDDSETIYDTDDPTLEGLRQYLTVTAYYDDSSSKEVINYTLSGELEVGQNTVTVSYSGKTATFSVTVTSGFDRIAYGTLTYRDIFITNNLCNRISDFETAITISSTAQSLGDGWYVKSNAGSPVLSTEASNTPTHSLKAFGTSSTQIAYYNETQEFAAGKYIVCASVKTTRRTKGNCGLQAGWPYTTAANFVQAVYNTVSSDFHKTASVITLDSAMTGFRGFVGTMNSANADCYVDDVVVSPVPSGMTEAEALTLYSDYLAMKGVS